MKHTRRHCGYTFVEVLFAAAILGLAIGGATRLVGTLYIEEETAYNQAVALNMQENASRLWQLGLSPTQVLGVLPSVLDNNNLAAVLQPDSSNNSVTWGTDNNVTLANSMGTLDNNSCTVTMNFIHSTAQAVTVQIYRPTIR
jgi:hypothetical protein